MPSSVIKYMLYDNTRSVLRIYFVSGLKYEYYQVPEEIYLEMKKASSKGQFLNKHIKGHYTYVQLEDD